MRLDSPVILLRELVREAYSAEGQLTLALPRVAIRAASSELRAALEMHLDETREQARRLEQIAGMLDFSAGGRPCKGMMGILAEGEDAMGYGGDPELVEAAIIGACRRVEHYEMALYMSMLRVAELAEGDGEAAELIETTLREEQAADEKLAAFSRRDRAPQRATTG